MSQPFVFYGLAYEQLAWFRLTKRTTIPFAVRMERALQVYAGSPSLRAVVPWAVRHQTVDNGVSLHRLNGTNETEKPTHGGDHPSRIHFSRDASPLSDLCLVGY